MKSALEEKSKKSIYHYYRQEGNYFLLLQKLESESLKSARVPDIAKSHPILTRQVIPRKLPALKEYLDELLQKKKKKKKKKKVGDCKNHHGVFEWGGAPDGFGLRG